MLALILLFVFIMSLAVTVLFQLSYSERMPRTPDPAMNRTVPVKVNHGIRVYVTRREGDLLESVNKFAPFLGAVSLLGCLAARRKYGFGTDRQRLPRRLE